MKTPKIFRKTRIAKEVTASVLAFGLAMPLAVTAQESETQYALEEIVVTATRRSESQQDVAIALRAIGERQLDDLRIDSFDDYVALIPGVNATGQGPGKKEVFIRGISPGRTAVRIAALGSEPSVANYLDETPISYAGRNIDLFTTDLSRIEILKGPQGTLFGASSQGGTVRFIANKPDLNEFGASVTVDLSDTSGGEGSETVEGHINIPFIEDKLGFRLAAYNANQGGFIDNIPATRQLALSNGALGGGVPSTRLVADNAAFARDDFNDAEYTGYRATALFNLNDDWNFTLQYVDQTLDTEGIFEFEPEVSDDGDLNSQVFNGDFGEDDVEILSLTVNGRIGNLDVVYNSSFTERDFEGRTDYTGYADVGPFIPYYICAPGYDFCGSPSLFTDSVFETKRAVNEIRVSTDSGNRVRFVGGVYLDNQQIVERSDFTYPASTLVGFQPNDPISTAFASDRSTRDPGVTFFNDFRTDREELSFFGEVAYDINDVLTATIGARNYTIDIGLTGSSNFNLRVPGDFGNNVDALLEGQVPAELSDTIFKLNLNWKIGENALVYATYSEGFRSGSFNRNGGLGPASNPIPFFFDTDDANNYEIGWKTTLFDNKVRFNGAAYFVDFTDLQQGVLDFSITNTTFFDNVGDAEIKGFEFNAEWAATENLNVFGSFSYIDSELVELPQTVTNISPVGSELPFAPETSATLGARYEQEFGELTGFVQGVAKYTDDRFTSLVQAQRFVAEGYTQVDASIGVNSDSWKASLYVENLTDELGVLDVGAPDLIFRVNPNRPRTLGVRFSYSY